MYLYLIYTYTHTHAYTDADIHIAGQSNSPFLAFLLAFPVLPTKTPLYISHISNEQLKEREASVFSDRRW